MQLSADPSGPGGKLGAFLVQAGLLTQPQLQAALALCRESDEFLGQAIVDLGFTDEYTLVSTLAKQCRIPHLSLADYQVSPDVAALVPAELCRRHRALPIDKLGRNVTLAMANPLDDAALAAFGEALPEARLKAFLCSHSQLQAALSKVFPPDPAAGKAVVTEIRGLPTPRATPQPSPAPEPEPAPATSPVLEPQPEIAPETAGAMPPEDAAATLVGTPRDAVPSEPRRLRPTLVCLEGWEIGREIALDGERHILGRGEEADTAFDSRLVSRRHAQISCATSYGMDSVVITDLCSSNGTYVNNVSVTSTALRDGDKVLVGDVLLKFVVQDEAEARFHHDVHQRIHYHGVTGLLAEEPFAAHLTQLIGRCTPETVAALILVDLDRLQELNEAHGRAAGASVLSDLGEIVQEAAPGGASAGMCNGHQAALLCPDMTLEEGFAVAEDLRRTFESRVFQHKDARFHVTLSAGVAAWPIHGKTADELMLSAEKALHEAKNRGRNQTVAAQ